MTTLPFALSVHKLVTSIGPDVAFAAIIGLAILVLLYFAQARETASLRERLDNAAQWIEALESRVSQLQRGQVPVAPRPGGPSPAPAAAGAQRPRPGQPGVSRPGGGPTPAGAGAGTSRPIRGPLLGAPAGMAGPALAAATHLIPVPGAGTNGPAPAAGAEDEQATQIGEPAVAGAAAARSAPSTQPGQADQPAAADQRAPASDDTILAAPAPATAAALANGQGSGTVAAPPAPRPTFAPAAGGPSPSRGSARPAGNGGGAAAAALTRSGASRQLPPLRTSVPPQPSRARRLVPILIGLAAVVVIVVALLVLTHNSSTSATVHKSHAVKARKHGKTAPVSPSSVNVAVLNGTSVTNLAHDVASRLGTDGYKEGTIATAADQTHTSTIVAYLPGHQADARAVAAILNLRTSAVQPVDQQAMGVACPGASTGATTATGASSSCTADVVVTVGTDLAGLASSTTG